MPKSTDTNSPRCAITVTWNNVTITIITVLIQILSKSLKMRLLHSFGLSLLAASVTASPQTQQSGQNNTRSLTVRTTNGLITGHLAGNVSSVVEFLGIPFAKPPVGELRFAAPQRLNTTAPFVATNWVSSHSKIIRELV